MQIFINYSYLTFTFICQHQIRATVMKKATATFAAKFFLLCLIFSLFSAAPGLAQTPTCGTLTPHDYTPDRLKNPKAYQDFLRSFKQQQQNRSSCINYAPIKAHILRRTDGTGGLTVAELNSAIATMNAFYANSCMAFYLCGSINYIDDDTYYDFDSSEEADLTGPNDVDNLINIYFCNEVTISGSSYCGYAYYPGNADRVMMDNSCTLNGSTLSHELGHFFSLPHTHSGGSELVDGSNCTTAGDRFCDTPADPNLSGNVNSDCDYTGTDTDDNGDSYMPNTHNVMSYSRKACRTEFSAEQYAAISYTFLNVRNYWDCLDFNVDFSVSQNTVCDNSTSISFSELAVGESSYEWDFDNDGTVDDTNANPTYAYGTDGTFDVKLSVSNGTFDISKVKTAHITTGAKLYPYHQSLDGFTVSSSASGYGDNWTPSPANTTSAYRWNTNDGQTPSSSTGPDGDHSQADGSGVYAFTECTNYSAGDVAELISPCIDIPIALAADYSIRFWYHMYGTSMGELHVDLYDGNTWINDFTPAIVGQQQTAMSDDYLERVFSVNAYAGQAIQIRFRGIRGTSYTSDMAIDDFELFDNNPLPISLTDFTGVGLENGQHLLHWETDSEQNSDHFSLEHSMDGIRFVPIVKIDAQGQSVQRQTYEHIYTQPQLGINYYRLKMVDWDGSFTYSAVLPLRLRGQQDDQLSISPNPGKGQYEVRLADSKYGRSYTVYNTIGQLVLSGPLDAGANRLSLDLMARSNGVYLLQIRNEAGQLIAAERFIKQ